MFKLIKLVNEGVNVSDMRGRGGRGEEDNEEEEEEDDDDDDGVTKGITTQRQKEEMCSSHVNRHSVKDLVILLFSFA